MEQPLHQPRNSKGQKYGKRQGRIIVPGLLPVLKPACLPECQCIPEHLYQAHDSQQQINSAGYKAMVMDHLKIGIMGMDAERTVRKLNSHLIMAGQVPMGNVTFENLKAAVGVILLRFLRAVFRSGIIGCFRPDGAVC